MKHIRESVQVEKTGGDLILWNDANRRPRWLVLIGRPSVEVQNWIKIIKTERAKKAIKNRGIHPQNESILMIFVKIQKEFVSTTF